MLFLVNRYIKLGKKDNWLLWLFVLFPIFAFSQSSVQSNCPDPNKQANIWYFGHHAGIDFHNNHPLALSDNNTLEMLEGNACICDKLGNFLLATGGTNTLEIFDRSLSAINYEYILGGNVSATQSSIIIPRPGDDDLFDVFFLNLPIDIELFENGLVYFTLDLSNINSPVIVNRPDTLQRKISEGTSAVLHENEENVWVVVHGWDSSDFYAYLITDEGLSNAFNPVISTVGTYRGGDSDRAIGTLKFSPDGSYLVYTFYEEELIELYSFDRSSGNVTYLAETNQLGQPVYGAAFSPNSKKLYVSTMHINAPEDFESRLVQFNLNMQNPLSSSTILATITNRKMFCGMQVAPDGKIYVARSPAGNDHLAVINNPNRPGIHCNLNNIENQQNEGFSLNGRTSSYGLPGFIQSYFDLSQIQYDSVCYQNETLLRLLNPTNIDSLVWFVEGAAISSEIEPVYTFPEEGQYEIMVTEYFNGEAYTSKRNIVIHPKPKVEINNGNDQAIIFGDIPAKLDAGGGYKDYLWSTGETTRSIEAVEPGVYTVDASNKYCCKASDDILVRVAKIFIPNAFMPESTGEDRTFHVVDYDSVIDQFDLRIYDRWGGLIFESGDKNEGWDGKGYQTGVYYFSMQAILIDGMDVQKTGNITLIR